MSTKDRDGDGVMDLFVGNYWIQLAKDGKSTIIPMLPGNVNCWSQDTIADLRGDGMAEILIGTQDGQVVVYETHKHLKPEWLQWATVGGDLRHTGCWHKPKS